MGSGGGGGGGGFDALVPAYVEGAGEALRAAYTIKSGTRILRVAPVAGIPYAAELGVVCGRAFHSPPVPPQLEPEQRNVPDRSLSKCLPEQDQIRGAQPRQYLRRVD